MTKLVLASVAIIGLFASRPAGAADVPAPVYKAPVAVAVYNWTGFYLGANAGVSAGVAPLTHALVFSTTAPTFATNGSADGFHTVSVEQQDAAGNIGAAANFNFTLDTTAPHLTGITASPGSGAVFAGSTVTFDLAFDEAVDVTGGIPTLALNDGASAVYDASATALLGDASKLVFDYLVSANDPMTPSLAVTGLVPHGATVNDLAGNPAVLTNVAAAFSALSINETVVPAYTIGDLTRPPLQMTAAGDIVLDPVAVAITSAYGIKFLYAGLPEPTPYPPADPHDFHLI